MPSEKEIQMLGDDDGRPDWGQWCLVVAMIQIALDLTIWLSQ